MTALSLARQHKRNHLLFLIRETKQAVLLLNGLGQLDLGLVFGYGLNDWQQIWPWSGCMSGLVVRLALCGFLSHCSI